MNRNEFHNVSIIIYNYLLNLKEFCKVNSLPDYSKSVKHITSENKLSLELLNVIIRFKNLVILIAIIFLQLKGSII
jgi:hypothetical protein